MFNLKGLLFWATIFFANFAAAYPNFIGYSYQSCLTCHYNPFGNGPLTDYGRAVSATAISDDRWTKDYLTKEELSEISGFMMGKVKNDYVKPHVNYRGLYLKTDLGEETSEARWINMMANVGAVFRPTKNDNFFGVVSIGYAPTPVNNPNSDESNYRSREHYVGYRLNKQHGFYAGMMDKVFGLRIPDHNSFSRTLTELTMNDGAHSLLYHFTNKSFDLGVQYFVGNLEQEDDIRPSGLTGQFEYSLNNVNRIGASLLTQSNEYVSKTMYAAHLRSGIDKGSSIMAEMGMISKEFESGKSVDSTYIFLQNHMLLSKGLFSILTFEYYKPDSEVENKILKIGPAIQYFPFNGVELRADVYNLKSISSENYSDDTWTFAGQVHLWL
jgi:hypothetical protein